MSRWPGPGPGGRRARERPGALAVLRVVRAALSPTTALAVLAASSPGGVPEPLAAQEGSSGPEVVADEFQRAFESMVWRAAALRMHPDALDRFHEVVTMLVETDARNEVPDRLLGGVGREAYPDLGAPEVFDRVMSSLLEETPGLMHALVTRRHHVVGSVREGADTVHVVYRVLPRLQGSAPEMKVMTLARAGGAGGPWRVLRSDELDVVRAALRGIPVGIPAPPPPPPDTGGVG